jgi:hypothetical protein
MMDSKISRVTRIGLAAATAFSALALLGVAPASANPAQDKVISTYCNNQSDDQACNDWRYNRDSWSLQQYQAFYSAHQLYPAFQTQEAIAAFSGATNTLPPPNDNATATEVRVTPGYTDTSKVYTNTPGPVESTPTGDVVKTVPEVIGDSPNHAADCAATFKSYDPATDTYMGLDGSREKCKL